MKTFLVTDPEINSVVAKVQAISAGAALDMAVAASGWDSYEAFLAHCEQEFQKNPRFGQRALEAVEIAALAEAA